MEIKTMRLYNNYRAIWNCFNRSGATKTISNIIKGFLKDQQFYEDQAGNILVGNFLQEKPCLVAHIDSVHTKAPSKISLIGDKLSAENGIGGDDKCGIVAILEILKSGADVNAIFTIDEEIGAIGASNLKFEAGNTNYEICHLVFNN